ncbi:MAG: peptidyl-prolyl cis-trans isomerase [bacterium]|nr:peptidyl-prolyl cis-trans isomerase [bacterium]
MKKFAILSVFFLSFLLAIPTVSAQESEERVIDEVVAQVNEGVITLSRVKREIKTIIEAEVQQGKKREDVQKAIDEKQGELIANLINEELLVQKAKELGMDADVENAINQRFVEIMKENNVKTLEALYEQMRGQNVNPQEIRDMWRKQITRERVIQREVQSKAYWEPNATQLKEYFEKNKAKFTKPETVSFSEIFLGYAGRPDEASVLEKAKQLLTQLRAGGNFDQLLKENGDKPIVAPESGKTEKATTANLNDVIKAPLAAVKVGGYSEPIVVKDLGVLILRLDAREAASGDSFFDEQAVRSAILQERFPEAQKKFFSTLRQDAYIKISDTYRPLVAPILFAEERKDKAVSEK